MIAQLLRKWFGLTEPVCQTCEILRDQLDESNRERRELLQRLLDSGKAESLPPSPSTVELQPIRPQHTPWRVRQQLLEQEDRRTAQLLRDKERELRLQKGINADPATVAGNIESLESELGLTTEGEAK